MDFAALKEMYAYLWEFIYAVLAIFGITKNEEGDLVKGE